MKKSQHPLARAFADKLAQVLMNRGVFVPRGDTSRPAVARPAGKPSKGLKALAGYQSRYTHVLSAMVADDNLAKLANRKAK